MIPLPPPEDTKPAHVESVDSIVRSGVHEHVNGKTPASGVKRQEPDVDKIDPNDTTQLTPENMKALLQRASAVSRENVKKTRQAFDATKAAADSGLLKTRRLPPK